MEMSPKGSTNSAFFVSDKLRFIEIDCFLHFYEPYFEKLV
jgi:hypothetical protein